MVHHGASATRETVVDVPATHLSGYVGRPPSEVAEAVYRTVTGTAKISSLGDVDVWDVVP